MAHQLDYITRNHILNSLEKIDVEGVPTDHEWSEYWIAYNSKLYQFKYAVEVASTFTNNALNTIDFKSNDSSRNYIASLGFQIMYSQVRSVNPVHYWVGASYYGHPGEQEDKFDEFIKGNYWRTDHYLNEGEGLNINALLQQVKINDRICIRYLDKKGGNIHIAAIGTVISTFEINDGKLGVRWDKNPPEFKGKKPSGAGSGNWWKTLFQLTRPSDIQTIFSENLIEQRAARISWNYHGWVMPSGPFGKSKNPETHEAKYGYGHEEWLFDTGKEINGYHYGFLEPIRKQQDAFVNNQYDVWLYSINGDTKKRYWIGWIRALTVIDNKEAEEVKKIYILRGWLKEMEDQIKSCGANEKGFSNWNGVDLFNVKFKASDLQENPDYIELPKDHPVNDLSRYNFAYYRNDFNFEASIIQDAFGFNPPEEGDHDDENEGTEPIKRKYKREAKPIEITFLHEAISKQLVNTLRKDYGHKNVAENHTAGYRGNEIDIVVNQDGQLIFYEIKTYNSLKTSIREALGQIIEYCYFPNCRKAKELIIVSQIPADEHTEIYFDHLRKTLKIDIFYQSYDLKRKSLSEKC